MKLVSQSMKDGRVEVVEAPEPTLRAQGVLVRTAWSLISAGTEGAKLALGQQGLVGKVRSRPDQARQVIAKARSEGVLRTYRTVKARLDERNPLGYSLAGVVVQVGELAAGLSVGDRVACGGGDYANHAEMVYVPANLCARVPDDVDLEDGAFATVGAVALQGIRQAHVTVGDRIAVLGLGLVGQLTVQLLRAAGCEVAGADPDASRCSAALRSGAIRASHAHESEVVRELEIAAGSAGFDAVIITAGTKSAGPIELAGKLARDRGIVVIVGDVGLNVPRGVFYEKELTLRLSRSYGPGRYDPVYEEAALDYPIGYVRWTEQRNMAEVLRLVQQGRLQVKPLVSHKFPIEDAVAAYGTVLDGSQSSMAVLLEYGGGRTRTARYRVAGRKAGDRQSSATTGVGLIGAGHFATATLLPALASDARFVPRGVFTPSGLSARDVAERWGFAFCAGSYQEVIDDRDTQAVIIATRHASHAELAAEALQAGKVVFVEKPLAMTESDLDNLVATQRRDGGVLMTGFNRRFAPATRKMLSVLERRSRPLIVAMRINAGPVPASHWIQDPQEGGGRIVGELCHFVDLANYLVGAPATQVHAVSADPSKPPLLCDNLVATLRYPDSSVATIVYSSEGDPGVPKERIEVLCERQVLICDDFRSVSLSRGGKADHARLRGQDKGHAAEIAAFLAMCRGDVLPPMTFASCVASTAATFGVVESLVTGRPVDVAQAVSD